MYNLICGSFAFDNILVFHDKFKNHILPDKVHILNVAFLVPTMRREFGGTAGNIAYNLKLLGGNPLPMGTVGRDFGPYDDWLTTNAIPKRYIKCLDDHFTAQAFITTDEDDNQITAFHPGAMSEAHCQRVDEVTEAIAWGIVSPDGKQAMIEHAAQFHARGIPFIFDPGQGLPMFGGDELLALIEQANILAVNDYEWQLVQDKTGQSAEALARRLEVLIVTRGGQGADFYTPDGHWHIDAVAPAQVVDPTGCGDAFRAGLLYGLSHGLDLVTTGRLASCMGTFKIEHSGPQNHRLTLADVKARLVATFGQAF